MELRPGKLLSYQEELLQIYNLQIQHPSNLDWINFW